MDDHNKQTVYLFCPEEKLPNFKDAENTQCHSLENLSGQGIRHKFVNFGLAYLSCFKETRTYEIFI